MAGEWIHTAGNWSGDPNDKGIRTSQDYRYFAISAQFPEFSNKDKTLVIQYSVKNEQKLDCFGAYLKLLSGDIDQKTFGGETDYRSSSSLNKLLMLQPEDWDENEYIPDPEDKNPEGYGDIPMEIPDPDAKKPEDWDEEEDGEWTQPTIPNHDYKQPKKLKNPNYKGIWTAPLIDNPEFKDDPDLYVFVNLKYVGFELWQVKSGTIFDNILLTDDPGYATKLAEETWGKHKDTEKAAFDEVAENMEDEVPS
ncbi:hypothetical protein Taro_028887 [Colocasia esculenta]|uniref:Calreticulin n=1 Tax=Colocasia esculenta TaxID=4460 RepID=A0A843VPG2_COLES|nr:hypothetical protein [Colocasia esculenta]